jgi:hypothetical protein
MPKYSGDYAAILELPSSLPLAVRPITLPITCFIVLLTEHNCIDFEADPPNRAARPQSDLQGVHRASGMEVAMV